MNESGRLLGFEECLAPTPIPTVSGQDRQYRPILTKAAVVDIILVHDWLKEIGLLFCSSAFTSLLFKIVPPFLGTFKIPGLDSLYYITIGLE